MSGSVETDPRIGSEIAGYRIERVLGRGGMGVVYQAHDLALDRSVALKLISPELAGDERFRSRFLRESRIAASIDHSHIVPIYDAGEAGGELYIAMRYVEGTDLKAILAEEGMFEPKRAVELLGQVASALDAAHERGLVHRDVKPANILVTVEAGGEEQVYLSDFGLTRDRGESEAAERAELVRRASGSLGTPDYAAPQQIVGEPIDERTDVYSLSCTLYECLTGSVPYRSESAFGVLFAHLEASPPAVTQQRPELPQTLDAIVAGGLAKDPDDRPETCGDLLAAAGAELLPQLGMFARVGRRGLVGLALLASLIAAAAVVPAMLLTGSGTGLAGAVPTTEPDVDVVQRIDPTTNELSATIPTGVTERGAAIGEGRGIAAAAGAVWMTNLVDQTVVRIDSQTNAAVVIGIRGPPSDLAVGPDEVWVTSFSAGEGRLTEVNATTSRVRRAVSLGSFEPIAVALGKTSVWIAAQDVGRGVLLRLDRQTLELVAEIPFPGRPSDLVVTGTDVWAISTPLTQVEKGVFRIDTSTNELVETIELPNPRAIAADEAVWVGDAVTGSLFRIDPATSAVEETTEFPIAPTQVAVGEGSVWLGFTDGTVARVDPLTGDELATIDVGRFVTGIAVDEGSVWAAVANETAIP